jgi:predicted phosphodiesterase
MVSKDRVFEIVEYGLRNGEDAALVAFNIPKETLNRYKREYRKHYGESADLFIKLKEQYTDEELQAIARGGRIIPGVEKAPIVSFDGDVVTFGIMSDNHGGSIYSDDSLVLAALAEMEKEGCQFLVHAGDCVEGMMNRPGSVYELSRIGYKAQRDGAVELFKNWGKPIFMVGGNHNGSFDSKFGVGMDITEDICSRIPGASYIGSLEGDISIGGVPVKVFHGNDGSSYALSYREQKIIDMMTPGERPSMLITGHTHKSMYFKYQGVQVICGGTLQYQTPFMRGKKLAAHVGWWIVTMCVKDGKIKWITPRWYDVE